MIHYVLFDDAGRQDLLPFTHTRPVADIRCGILTNRERWQHLCGAQTSTLTVAYLQPCFPLVTGTDNLYLNGAFMATPSLAAATGALQPGQCIRAGARLVAVRLVTAPASLDELLHAADTCDVQPISEALRHLVHPWDIFRLNGPQLDTDFDLLTAGRISQPLPAHIWHSGSDRIFVEEGAEIGMGCILNAHTGPIYIGRNAKLLEGVMVHGPLAVCEQAVVKMGAKIYGETTIGPGCKVGGELTNVVFFANSNKGHDGYLGNSVVGEWCNLGADTNTSNLKNNYDVVKVHREHTNRLENTGLIFCGLLMGDHSKSGINTMFNTGTVVGVSANIFGGDFQPKFLPSFSWGGADGLESYQFQKAMETAARMMERRHKTLSETEIAMYRHIYDHTRHQIN
jgi:UDP-N-acetylglucosamine diphosphorylase/glucosamine-1-phosphate N-acetyltransferase